MKKLLPLILLFSLNGCILIEEEKNDRLVFVSDYEFSSPSAAAAIIHGGQASGLTSWKDSKGNSLKQKEEKDIQQLNALDS